MLYTVREEAPISAFNSIFDGNIFLKLEDTELKRM